MTIRKTTKKSMPDTATHLREIDEALIVDDGRIRALKIKVEALERFKNQIDVADDIIAERLNMLENRLSSLDKPDKMDLLSDDEIKKYIGLPCPEFHPGCAVCDFYAKHYARRTELNRIVNEEHQFREDMRAFCKE